MECYYCKGELESGVTSYFVKRKGYQILIDRVPALICAQCGEYLFREQEVDLIQEVITALEQKLSLIGSDDNNYDYLCGEDDQVVPRHQAV